MFQVILGIGFLACGFALFVQAVDAYMNGLKASWRGTAGFTLMAMGFGIMFIKLSHVLPC